MPNPLTVVDDAVLHAPLYWPPLGGLIPHGNNATKARVYRFDRTADLRNQTVANQMSGKVWVIPTDSPLEPYDDANSARLVLNYQVGYIKRIGSVEDMRLVQYEIVRAYLMMSDYLLPSPSQPGGPLQLAAYFDPTPWQWLTISARRAEQRREPLVASDRWQSLVDVTVNLVGNKADVYTV